MTLACVIGITVCAAFPASSLSYMLWWISLHALMTKKLESGLQHLGYHLSVGSVWNAFRGEVQFVEATSMEGKGDLHLTGQLGDVIKESAHIALTWVRSRATELKFAAMKETNLLEGLDVYIHFPAGAIPKDGPFAGFLLKYRLLNPKIGLRLRSMLYWFVPKPIDKRSSSRICTRAGRIQSWKGLKYTVAR
ncbi:hypothetical protein AgCh_021876 [Apium graveolens]